MERERKSQQIEECSLPVYAGRQQVWLFLSGELASLWTNPSAQEMWGKEQKWVVCFSGTGTWDPGDTRWPGNRRNSSARQHSASCPFLLRAHHAPARCFWQPKPQRGRDHLASGTPGTSTQSHSKEDGADHSHQLNLLLHELTSKAPFLHHLSRLSGLIKVLLSFLVCSETGSADCEKPFGQRVSCLHFSGPADPVSGRFGLNLCYSGGGQGKAKPVAHNELLMHWNVVFNML